jgi:hypothetical protein
MGPPLLNSQLGENAAVKIALKYGLLITLCFIAWFVIAHWLVPDPMSLVHRAGSGAFVNLVQIVAIWFGMKAQRTAHAGALNFKDGIKTGVAISFVYALSSCLFFVFELWLIGPKYMASEPIAPEQSLWKAALPAFLGLFVLSVLFGLIYSTIISFVLVRRHEAGERPTR